MRIEAPLYLRDHPTVERRAGGKALASSSQELQPPATTAVFFRSPSEIRSSGSLSRKLDPAERVEVERAVIGKAEVRFQVGDDKLILKRSKDGFPVAP
jgi:hypothetical protein